MSGRINSYARDRDRLGFSLLEMVVSLMAASLLLAGLASTIFVASRAADTQQGPLPRLVEGTRAAEQISSELHYALAFTQRTPTLIEFTVADRNNDSSPETIRYQWTGTPGGALTRQINGAPAVEVAANVHHLKFNYQMQTVTESHTQEVPGNPQEVLLAQFNGWSGVSAVNSQKPANSTNWVSQYFRITNWPPNVNELSISKVVLTMNKVNDAAISTIGIYPAANGTGPDPMSTPIGSLVTFPGTALTTTYLPKEFTFSDVVVSNPNIGYCIVVKGTNGTNSVNVRHLLGAAAPVDLPVLRWTTNSGSSWQPSTNSQRNDALFSVFGTYTTTTTETVDVNRQFVRGVNLALQVGTDTAARVNTAAQVLNAPEVAVP